MRRVASIPSSTGMRMSISTRSGAAVAPLRPPPRRLPPRRRRRFSARFEDLAQADPDERLVVGDQHARHLSLPASARASVGCSPRSMPSSRRSSVSVTTAQVLDRAQFLAGRAAGAVEQAPLAAGLHDDDREVVGDRVVQLARDPRPLLHDRRARRQLPLPLRQLSAPLPTDNDVRTSSIAATETSAYKSPTRETLPATAMLAATKSARPSTKPRRRVQAASAYMRRRSRSVADEPRSRKAWSTDASAARPRRRASASGADSDRRDRRQRHHRGCGG